MNARKLIVVVDLASDTRAIDLIVVQGDGAGAPTGDSHLGRFEEILAEYRGLRCARPGFVAHRDVARNPVMHPPDADDRVHVTDDAAATALYAANAAYLAMHKLLARQRHAPTPGHMPAHQERAVRRSSCAATRPCHG